MFKDNLCVHDGKKLQGLNLYVGRSESSPMIFKFWAAELARDVLRLGVFFHAAGVFLQIPGAAEFEWVSDEDFEEEQNIDSATMFGQANRNTLLAVLANCLERLGVQSLIEQVAPDACFCHELSAEWTFLIERRAKIDDGLLSLVADCLDQLLVTPGMHEIEKADEPYWWHRYRVSLRKFDCPG